MSPPSVVKLASINAFIKGRSIITMPEDYAKPSSAPAIDRISFLFLTAETFISVTDIFGYASSMTNIHCEPLNFVAYGHHRSANELAPWTPWHFLFRVSDVRRTQTALTALPNSHKH